MSAGGRHRGSSGCARAGAGEPRVGKGPRRKKGAHDCAPTVLTTGFVAIGSSGGASPRLMAAAKPNRASDAGSGMTTSSPSIRMTCSVSFPSLVVPPANWRPPDTLTRSPGSAWTTANCASSNLNVNPDPPRPVPSPLVGARSLSAPVHSARWHCVGSVVLQNCRYRPVSVADSGRCRSQRC